MPGNLQPGSTLGSYRIEKLLGKGGMGEVYLAEDQRLKRNVALKILPADVSNNETYLKRFHREAESAASFHHPNICVIHEIGESEGQTFIAMEYCEGMTLQQRIAEGPMELDEVLDIGIQIADALEEARKKKIVHRDIKSSNILLSDKKQVKVLDFGLAKHTLAPDQDLSQASTAARVTDSGVVVGTVAYMSPEQALGKQVDHRTDIYSFGVMLYEMLTGRLPFAGNSTPELLDAILHKEPPSIARYNEQIPDPLIRTINKMLRKDPEERYQSVHEIWVNLKQLKRESTSQATIGAAKPEGMPAKLRYSAFGIGIAIAVIIAAIFFLRPAKETAQIPQAASEITSLVALPSKVYGKEEFVYLSDAIPSTISTLLGEIDGFEMKMPPTSLEVEQVKGDLKRIADAYGVGTFLVSSVTAQQGQLIIDVQLVEAHGRSVLWSKQYEGTESNYIELTRRAADGIRGVIRPEASTLIAKAESGALSESELQFQKGKYYSNIYNNRHQEGDFKIALASFERALELNPKLADAAAEIAMLHVFQIEATDLSPDTLAQQVEAWGQRALKIDSRCGLGWTALQAATVFQPNADTRKWTEYGIKAVFFGAKNGLNYTSLQNGLASSVGLQMAAMQEGLRVDPLYLNGHTNLAGSLRLLGRGEEALNIANYVLSIEPEMAVALNEKVADLIVLGRWQEASQHLDVLEKHVVTGRLPPTRLLYLKLALELERGDRNEAAGFLEKVERILFDPKTSTFDLFQAIYILVPSLTRHGDRETAMKILTRCVEAGAVPEYDWLLLNPDLAPLRGDPRFQQVVSAARKQFDEMLATINEARSRGEFPKFLEKPLAEHLKELGYEKDQKESL